MMANPMNGRSPPHPFPLATGAKGRLNARSPRGAGRLLIAWAFILVVGLWMPPSAPALAVDPQEQLKDPALEARARDISAGLRCLVCQNESIDDSDAPLAHDLRLIVRQQLQKGESNDQVVDYIVARYGEFVLLKPRLHLNTLLLWLAPALLLLGGILLGARVIRRQPADQAVTPLSAEEERELDAVFASAALEMQRDSLRSER